MSTIPTYQKINAFMESAKPSVYTKSNTEGLDRVRKEDGMYAYFMEAASIEYNIERYCDLRQLGGLLDSKGYGIALPKGWCLKHILNRMFICSQLQILHTQPQYQLESYHYKKEEY